MPAWRIVLMVLLCGMDKGVAAAAIVKPVPLPMLAQAEAKGVPDRPLIVEVMLHDTLQKVSLESFRAAMVEANRRTPAAILLNLSTPGGLPESAAAMATTIEQSRAPVVVYLREPGTGVSGEGMRLIEAGDVRVMVERTTLKPALAASASEPAATGKTQSKLLAALEMMATRHGRTAFTMERLLEQHGPLQADEALNLGAIDLIEPSEDHLLERLDGRSVHRADGSVTVLRLAGGSVSIIPMTAREHMMRALMNPDLTVLLLALGGLLLYLEVNTPGGVVPGAAGLLLVLLAVYALLHMPLRWEGLLLLACAGIFLLAEAHFRRWLMFAGLSMLTLVVGLRLLVRSPIPELEVNWGTAVGAGVGFGGVTAGLLLLGLKARRAKVRTGAEAMLGWLAVTQTQLAPEGEILVRGELWRARLTGSDAFLPAGEAVKVERAMGAVLEVVPLPNLQGS